MEAKCTPELDWAVQDRRTHPREAPACTSSCHWLLSITALEKPPVLSLSKGGWCMALGLSLAPGG